MGVGKTVGVVRFPFDVLHDSSEELERGDKMISLHISKGGYGNEPHLVEMTLRRPRCHPYRHPQIPY